MIESYTGLLLDDGYNGRAFIEEGFHGCEECHGNHGVAKTSDSMVGNTGDAVCLNCHEDGDKGFEVAGRIHAAIDSLATSYQLATARQHARAFVDAYSGEDTIFFANGRWDRYRTQSGVAFTPLTPATLGAVVVAVHPAYAACLVVDDED